MACATGAVEVKLELASGATPFERLYCLDFIRNDGGTGPQPVEMSADWVAPSAAAAGSRGGVRITIAGLVWNDVAIEWPAPELAQDALAGWFERWFDPDDRRLDTSATFGSVIHSLSPRPTTLFADLGSAPPEAFWELVDALGAAGVTRVTVRPSSVQPTA